MTARILYLGTDTCHRLPVLVRAGYLVDNYENLELFRESAQLDLDTGPDAVLLTDLDASQPDGALAFTRRYGSPPVIVFRDHNLDFDSSDFDLVIPPLTPPRRWLGQIGDLIQERRGFAAEARRGQVRCDTLSASDSAQNSVG